MELEGVALADTSCPVLLFETGLPTRYYIDGSDVAFEHLEPTDTQTLCPYKGVTSQYWSARVGDAVHPDLAWTYHYPLPAVAPIAGMVAFYNEKLDIIVDGVSAGSSQDPLQLTDRPTLIGGWTRARRAGSLIERSSTCNLPQISTNPPSS